MFNTVAPLLKEPETVMLFVYGTSLLAPMLPLISFSITGRPEVVIVTDKFVGVAALWVLLLNVKLPEFPLTTKFKAGLTVVDTSISHLLEIDTHQKI